MLITEELFLLLRRDDGKPASAFAQTGYGLVGALISDLVLAGHVTVTEDTNPRVEVVPDTSAEHPVLAAALELLRQRDGTKLSTLVADSKLNPERDAARSLSNAGVIRIAEKRALGLVPEKYPVIDTGPEAALRARLRAALAGTAPRPADGVLLSVLHGLDLVSTILKEETREFSRKNLKRRIEEISADSVSGHAVAKAVRTMNAAIMSAAVLPTIVAGAN